MAIFGTPLLWLETNVDVKTNEPNRKTGDHSFDIPKHVVMGDICCVSIWKPTIVTIDDVFGNVRYLRSKSAIWLFQLYNPCQNTRTH